MEDYKVADERTYLFFEEAIKRKCLVNTYLLTGQNIENNILFAQEIIQKILGTLTHPDYFEYLEALKVDVARNINQSVYIKPYSASKKCYIISLQEATTEAQNALLKTLEEPPEYVVIFLIAPDVKNVLPTIVSRSLVIPIIGSIKFEKETVEYDKEMCLVLSQLSEGNYNTWLQLLEEGTEHEKYILREQSLNFLEKSISNSKMFYIQMEVINEILQDKDSIVKTLIFWQQAIIDVIMLKSGQKPLYYIEKQHYDILKKLSQEEFSSLGNFQRQIIISIQYLNNNVSAQYILENLLLML